MTAAAETLSQSWKPGVVIIGAGHAGGSAAAFLRQYGYKGSITLIGDETSPPYQRPPLSKAWLMGRADHESLLLKPASWYEQNSIGFHPGVTAKAVDPANQTVALSFERTLSYEHLILATGARARRLDIPGADLAGVHVLRTDADAEALKNALNPGRHLVVIGAGYVGLEVAASARALGAHVTVIERESRVLARVACEALADAFYARHTTEGVLFVFNAGVVEFENDGSRISGVVLDDGRVISCDAVLVGVGAVPNVELALDAGLSCNDGIMVDSDSRSSNPSIYAIGDVTRRPLPFYEKEGRLESVPNALEQARQAAAAIAGKPSPAAELPWFWSDQYDLKLQIAGLAHDADHHIIRGDVASGTFAIFHLKGPFIQAVEAVNSPAAFLGGRQLIQLKKKVAPEKLSDPEISIKSLIS